MPALPLKADMLSVSIDVRHKRTSAFSLPATSSFEARCLGNSDKTPEQKWQRLIVS
jgi:hypothetical protein